MDAARGPSPSHDDSSRVEVKELQRFLAEAKEAQARAETSLQRARKRITDKDAEIQHLRLQIPRDSRLLQRPASPTLSQSSLASASRGMRRPQPPPPGPGARSP